MPNQPKEENILEAHARIYKSLIFMISCYDTNYAFKYLDILNKKTFNNYFTIIKTDDTKEINNVYDNSNKIIIYIVKLPIPQLYSFNFLNDIYHIHIAVKWAKTDKDYVNDIKQIPINKFINVKDDKKEYYDNKIEDDIYDTMIKLIDNKLNKNNTKKEFKRMTPGNNLIINGSRKILLN